MRRLKNVLMLGVKDTISHPLRTLLALASVALSVGALLCMLALTAGIAENIASSFQQGNRLNAIRITPQAPPPEQEEFASRSPGLTLRDVELLRLALPERNIVSPIFELNEQMPNISRRTTVRIRGIEPEYFQINSLTLREGRSIQDGDVELKNRVIVLGDTVREMLEERNLPTHSLSFRDVRFETVGILNKVMTESDRRALEAGANERRQKLEQERNSRVRPWDPFRDLNDQILMPITSMMATLGSTNMQGNQNLGPHTRINSIDVFVADLADVPDLTTLIFRTLMVSHNGIEDFGLRTPEADTERLREQVFAARFTGAAIAGTTLLIGFLGIANLMLSALSDRIREIGIQQSVGATPMDLFLTTLSESVIIAVVGSVLGFVLSLIFMDILVFLAPVSNAPILLKEDVVASFLVTWMAGIFAGLYPAWKASQLNPVDALRYE